MILATIAISISSYYRDILNYRHYRPALIGLSLFYTHVFFSILITGKTESEQLGTLEDILQRLVNTL